MNDCSLVNPQISMSSNAQVHAFSVLEAENLLGFEVSWLLCPLILQIKISLLAKDVESTKFQFYLSTKI